MHVNGHTEAGEQPWKELWWIARIREDAAKLQGRGAGVNGGFGKIIRSFMGIALFIGQPQKKGDLHLAGGFARGIDAFFFDFLTVHGQNLEQCALVEAKVDVHRLAPGHRGQ